MFDHPHRKKVFSYLETKFPIFQFVPIASCPVTVCYWEESGFIFFTHSHQVFIHVDPPEPSLHQAQQSYLLFTWEMFGTLNHLQGPSADSLQYVHVFFVLGSPDLDPALQMRLTSANHLPMLSMFGNGFQNSLLHYLPQGLRWPWSWRGYSSYSFCSFSFIYTFRSYKNLQKFWDTYPLFSSISTAKEYLQNIFFTKVPIRTTVCTLYYLWNPLKIVTNLLLSSTSTT